MQEVKTELKTVVDWLNENYDQKSENYDIFFGSKPGVIEYNNHIALSPWACGAIVCFYDQLFFICEDDGNWFLNEGEGRWGKFGYQTGFSMGWCESFMNAMANLRKYVEEHGTPVYFSGTDVLCHYRLGGK